MNDWNKAPHRAVRLTLILDADTDSEMASALHNIAERIDRGEMTNGVSGGPSSGSIYEILRDPKQTHERYFSEVADYLSRAKAASAASGN